MAFNINMNLNELNLEDIGSWPPAVKKILIGLVCVIIIFLGFWFDTREQINQLKHHQQTEVKLKKKFEVKQQHAVNLDAYKVQLSEISRTFGKMLHQLPSKTEVPGLLEDISETGVANGLEFKLFDPQAEVQRDFYAELPIRISVVGNYHQLAQFVSDVAALSRIVTLHDFEMFLAKPDEEQVKSADFMKRKMLGMVITAKTYRYTALRGDSNEQN